jgi:hypothetical protein
MAVAHCMALGIMIITAEILTNIQLLTSNGKQNST